MILNNSLENAKLISSSGENVMGATERCAIGCEVSLGWLGKSVMKTLVTLHKINQLFEHHAVLALNIRFVHVASYILHLYIAS